jgi:uncharacterized integral membrane protein (TIGR00697 family)
MIILSLFITTVLVSNIASTKLFNAFGFTIDGGTILFPLAYVLADVITEVYGFKAARKVVFLGFLMSVLMTSILFIVQLLPPAAGWTAQESYEQILGLLPRIIAGSLVAYLIGELTNSYILAKMKVATKGKYLWTRTIGSTLVAALLDTVIFSIIAFYGVIPTETLISLILTVYVIKVLVEIAVTPITYAVVGYLKRVDKQDFYDKDLELKTIIGK